MLSGFELYPRWVPLLAWHGVLKLMDEIIPNLYYVAPDEFSTGLKNLTGQFVRAGPFDIFNQFTRNF